MKFEDKLEKDYEDNLEEDLTYDDDDTGEDYTDEEEEYEELCRRRMDKIFTFTDLKYKERKQKDKFSLSGNPLDICGVLYLSNNFILKNIIVALLHTVIEDLETIEEELKSWLEVTEEEMEAIRLLAKEKYYNMEDFLNTITENNIARIVKIADRIYTLQNSLIEEETDSFRYKYLVETKKYFKEIAKGTGMEWLLEKSMESVESLLKSNGFVVDI